MKTPRPEHRSFLCPPQSSLLFPRLLALLPGFIYLWLLPAVLCVYTLFQSLSMFLKGCWLNLCSAFISHLHLSPPLPPSMPFTPSLP